MLARGKELQIYSLLAILTFAFVAFQNCSKGGQAIESALPQEKSVASLDYASDINASTKTDAEFSESTVFADENGSFHQRLKLNATFSEDVELKYVVFDPTDFSPNATYILGSTKVFANSVESEEVLADFNSFPNSSQLALHFFPNGAWTAKTIYIHKQNPSAATQAEELALGEHHSCLLDSEGHVYCWGGNSFGELGLGHNTPSSSASLLPNLEKITQLAAGANHTCALLENKTVKCWGRNNFGQLGNSTFVDTSTPGIVAGLNYVVKIKAGANHTCALKEDHSLSCWGMNQYGQLGIGSNMKSAIPVSLGSLQNIVDLDLGGYHSCAIDNSGTSYCWGKNEDGQLGLNDNLSKYSPALLNSTNRFIKFSLGLDHSCAISSDYSIWCWGSNTNHIIPHNPSQKILNPTKLANFKDATELSAKGNHACHMNSTRDVFCWGDNTNGQVGSSRRSAFEAFAEVSKLKGAKNIYTYRNNTCFIDANSRPFCWGSNGQFAKLGSGSIEQTQKMLFARGLSGMTRTVAGGNTSCSLNSNGDLQCWGKTQFVPSRQTSSLTSSFPMPLNIAEKISTVKVGPNHSCAITESGKLYCWGSNIYGQIGLGFKSNSSTAQQILDSKKFKDVSVGDFHTCAISEDGSALCWGANNMNQLGVPQIPESLKPVSPATVPKLSQLTSGSVFTCGLTEESKSVMCWGANHFGQLGVGSTAASLLPQTLSDLGHVQEISAGANHVCAQTEDNSLFCWGNNSDGQIGNGSLTLQRKPYRVTELNSKVKTFALGGAHTCASTSDNKLYCWGQNEKSQLGIYTTEQNLLAPTEVTSAPDSVISLASGSEHTCAGTASGYIQCWGSNSDGQMGQLHQSFSLQPILIKF